MENASAKKPWKKPTLRQLAPTDELRALLSAPLPKKEDAASIAAA